MLSTLGWGVPAVLVSILVAPSCSEDVMLAMNHPNDSGTLEGSVDGAGDGLTCDPCRLLPPLCGCPEGQACRRRPEWGSVCGELGPGALGEPCVSDDDCGAGMGCAAVEVSPGQGTCGPYCLSTGDCGDGLCAGQVDMASVCSPDCNPVQNTGCPDGMACYFVFSSPIAVPSEVMVTTFCMVISGTREESEGCSSTADCRQGLVCANDACRTLCVVGGDDCPNGYGCIETIPPAVVRGVEYGFCHPS